MPFPYRQHRPPGLSKPLNANQGQKDLWRQDGWAKINRMKFVSALALSHASESRRWSPGRKGTNGEGHAESAPEPPLGTLFTYSDEPEGICVPPSPLGWGFSGLSHPGPPLVLPSLAREDA